MMNHDNEYAANRNTYQHRRANNHEQHNETVSENKHVDDPRFHSLFSFSDSCQESLLNERRRQLKEYERSNGSRSSNLTLNSDIKVKRGVQDKDVFSIYLNDAFGSTMQMSLFVFACLFVVDVFEVQEYLLALRYSSAMFSVTAIALIFTIA